MEQRKTVVYDTTPHEFISLFEKVIDSKISDLKANFEPKKPTEFLTRNEVKELLKVDLSTVHNWTKKGKLKSYGIGNRVYYKRCEVENTLIFLNQESC